jgi:hypothetical protein
MPVAGCCECGDEPFGSCTMELVTYGVCTFLTVNSDYFLEQY